MHLVGFIVEILVVIVLKKEQFIVGESIHLSSKEVNCNLLSLPCFKENSTTSHPNVMKQEREIGFVKVAVLIVNVQKTTCTFSVLDTL